MRLALFACISVIAASLPIDSSEGVVRRYHVKCAINRLHGSLSTDGQLALFVMDEDIYARYTSGSQTIPLLTLVGFDNLTIDETFSTTLDLYIVIDRKLTTCEIDIVCLGEEVDLVNVIVAIVGYSTIIGALISCAYTYCLT